MKKSANFPAGKNRNLISRAQRHANLETPLHLLDTWITPADLFFVRNHFPQPKVDAKKWRLRITGAVSRPLEFSLAQLSDFKQFTVTAALECAGNGRSFFRPRTSGVPWSQGAVGNAAFTGPRLADVLRSAGIKARGKHVAFCGLDRPSGKGAAYVRSIPVEKALSRGTLLATHMNGEPLRGEHGFPLRAIVPGWIGAASVKWLAEIRVIEREFSGYYMATQYRIPRKPVEPGRHVPPEKMVAMTSLEVKSIITHPRDGARCGLAPIQIRGAAWACEEDIARVEISSDLGKSWHRAKLGGNRAKYAWRFWEFTWKPPAPGTHMLLARARDTKGRTQPISPHWNPGGYLWNAIGRIRIKVKK